jgi:endo-1,3-1,4-beta-glycanase ExoK
MKPTVLLAALLLCAPVAGGEAQEATGRSFVDNFENLDLNRWFASNGWAGGDHTDCTLFRRNVAHRPGAVDLILRKDPNRLREFSCGDLQSHQTYGYGTYEVRMRAAEAPGLVSAFFTFTRASDGSGHDEIDIEFLGKDRRLAQLGIFASGMSYPGFDARLDPDATTMNDYAFEWLPDSIRWFIGGKVVHELHRTPDKPFPFRPGKIFLSIWNGRGQNMEQWLGRFVDPGVPLVATVERVSFTEMGQPCQFPTSVACQPGANGRPAE